MSRNLVSVSPFFIVKDLQASIAYYRERLGFQLDFQGPDGDPYYAGVSRDGIGIMLETIAEFHAECYSEWSTEVNEQMFTRGDTWLRR